MIGDNIKRIREKHGLTQKEFGNIAGVSDKTVSTWELGKKIPRMGPVEKICEHFGIKKSYLYDDVALKEVENDEKNKLLSEDEIEIIEMYKKLDEKQRQIIYTLLKMQTENK